MTAFSFTGEALDPVTGLSDNASVSFTVKNPLNWILDAWDIHLLYQQDPLTATLNLNDAANFGTGSSLTSSPIEDAFITTPVLRYTSYAQFSSDISSGAITYPYKWLLYDTEDWADTPQDEINDPWTYSGKFATLAHAHGMKLIVTPARDLGNNTACVKPKKSGETLDQWCMRVNLFGGIAGEGADLVVIQAQVDTASLGAYDDLVDVAVTQMETANPDCLQFAELSTNYGTAQQMAIAAQSVTVDGFYVSVTTAAIPQLDSFFKLM